MRLSRLAAAMTAGLAFCLLLLPIPASSHQVQDKPSDQEVALRTVVNRHIDSAGIDGVVLVARQGIPLFREGFGLADRTWNLPNTPDTRFRIASMTKSFTAVLTMQLVQEGKIDLDATIRAYLPSYPADHGDRITVRQLLAHQSGIPHYAELPGWRDGRFRAPLSDEEFVAVFAAQPLNFAPGSQSRYSNSNYYLLGLIIETLTGQSYADAIDTRILTPLGMTGSGEFKQGEIVAGLAADYMPNGEEISCMPHEAAYCKSGFVNMALFQATGSLHSTADDLLKWDQALYGEQLLSADSKAILFNPESPFAWTIGALPVDEAGATVDVIAYNGGINGYTSFIARFPETRHTIIILNNNGAGYDALLSMTAAIAKVLMTPTGD